MSPAEVTAEAVTSFATLFTIIDPIALLPIFIALTAGQGARERMALARRSTLIAFVVLAVFALVGEPLLRAIGIGMPAFRVAGGLLLFLIAAEMLFEKRTPRREKAAESGDDPSVFPLAVPLLAGPGALTTIVLLMEAQDTLAGQATILGALALVMVIAFLLLGLAGLVERALGRVGITVITRVLGILLAALSVQFVLDGLAGFGMSLAPG